MQRYRIIGVLAAIAMSTGLISATTAQAASPALNSATSAMGVEKRSEKVDYRDLDLRQQSDVRKLEHRVRKAVKRVCTGAVDRECEIRSWRDAVSQIDRVLKA